MQAIKAKSGPSRFGSPALTMRAFNFFCWLPYVTGTITAPSTGIFLLCTCLEPGAFVVRSGPNALRNLPYVASFNIHKVSDPL